MSATQFTIICEDEFGAYQPIGEAIGESEAREIAVSDVRSRTARLERGEDAGICPYVYKLWKRVDGEYVEAVELMAADL